MDTKENQPGFSIPPTAMEVHAALTARARLRTSMENAQDVIDALGRMAESIGWEPYAPEEAAAAMASYTAQPHAAVDIDSIAYRCVKDGPASKAQVIAAIREALAAQEALAVDAQVATDDEFIKNVLTELAKRGASAAGLSLAAQLLGAGACDGCGYRKLHCRCIDQVPFASPTATTEQPCSLRGTGTCSCPTTLLLCGARFACELNIQADILQYAIAIPAATTASASREACSACDGKNLQCDHCDGMGIEPRKVVGYRECYCLPSMLCDGMCKPIYADGQRAAIEPSTTATDDQDWKARALRAEKLLLTLQAEDALRLQLVEALQIARDEINATESNEGFTYGPMANPLAKIDAALAAAKVGAAVDAQVVASETIVAKPHDRRKDK